MKALHQLIKGAGGVVAFARSIDYSHPYVSRVAAGGPPSTAFCQAVKRVYGVSLDPSEWPDARRRTRGVAVEASA